MAKCLCHLIAYSTLLFSCSEPVANYSGANHLNGVWQSCDDTGNYSEMYIHNGLLKFYLRKSHTISQAFQFRTIGDTILVKHFFGFSELPVFVIKSDVLTFLLSKNDIEYSRVSELVGNWNFDDALQMEASKREREADCSMNVNGMIYFEF